MRHRTPRWGKVPDPCSSEAILFEQNVPISFEVCVRSEHLRASLLRRLACIRCLPKEGNHHRDILGFRECLCASAEEVSLTPSAARGPPKRNGTSNLNTNGRKEDSFSYHRALECLHQKGCLVTWCSFRTLSGATLLYKMPSCA